MPSQPRRSRRAVTPRTRAGAEATVRMLQAHGVKAEFVIDEGMLITEGMIAGLAAPAAIVGVVAGVVFGLITSAVPYAMSKGTRDFSSTMQLVAGRYDVLCDPQNAEKARDLLARLTI